MDRHQKAFFGKKTALIIKSPSRSDPHIFITTIKAKDNGDWEKPSRKEGKTISLNLGEIAMLKVILYRKREEWSTFHSYKNHKTLIKINWDKQHLWFTIAKYHKILKGPEIEILKAFIDHLFKEKIEFATDFNFEDQPKEEDSKKKINNNSKMQTENSAFIVNGIYKGQENSSYYIHVLQRGTFLIPQTSIFSEIILDSERLQEIRIDRDYALRNNIIKP